MATTTYSYAQIVTGFSGYFDVTTTATRRCMQANSTLFLMLTGTDASIKVGSGGSTVPFFVTVDGVESNPTMASGAISLFSGLTDTRHVVSIQPKGTTFPTFNWFTTTETAILSVTGASPAMTPIPMHYATWSTFPGISTFFTDTPAGGNITPTERPVYPNDPAIGVMSFIAACDSIYVLSGNGPLKYSIDGGTIQTVTVTTATTARHVVALATGLDSGAEHEYSIWLGNAGEHPQAVACTVAGVSVSIGYPGDRQKVFLYGSSTVYGMSSTIGDVDIFKVGLNSKISVAKWGVAGLTIAGMTANIPTYFTKSGIPDYVLCGIGRNNVGSSTFQADYTACIQAFLTAGCTKIICRGFWPEGTTIWTTENALIQAAIASFSNPDIVYMDTTTWTGIATVDGLHPTTAGYATVAAYETPALLALMEPTYTLSFDANGATSGTAPASSEYQPGSVTLPLNTGVLAKTDYTISGWNTNAGGTGTHYDLGGAYTMPELDTTLYAEWLINPPVNSVKPTVSGPAVVGQPISGSNGTWTNSPAYTYQWQKLDSTWTNISGATSINYSPVSSDVGFVLRLVVTATNAGGSGPAESLQTSTVFEAGVAGGEYSFGFFG